MENLLMDADFKSQFSDVLDKVRQGEEVVLGYGRKIEKIAVRVPYDKYRRTMAKGQTRRAGSLAGKGKVIFQDDFKISDDELLRP